VDNGESVSVDEQLLLGSVANGTGGWVPDRGGEAGSTS